MGVLPPRGYKKMRDYNKFLKDNTPCILCNGVKNKEGYGVIAWIDGKTWGVHRLLFKLFRPDEFKEDLLICHHCDNPSCVNIEHLYAGTTADNMFDRFEHNFNKEEMLKQLQYTFMKRKIQRRG